MKKELADSMILVGPFNSGYFITLRILCSFKRQNGNQSLALHGAQGTHRNILCQPYLCPKNPEGPWIGKVAGQLKMSAKIPKLRSVCEQLNSISLS